MQRLVLIGCIAIAMDGEIAGSAVPRRHAVVGSIYFPFMPQVVGPPRIHMRRVIALQHHQMREEDRVMSLNLVTGIDFPNQLPTATAPYVLLGLSSTTVPGSFGRPPAGGRDFFLADKLPSGLRARRASTAISALLIAQKD